MSESNPTNQVIYAVDIYDFSHPLQVDATGALRVTGSFISSTDVNINQVGGAPFTLGQKTMANSMPVVIASDQSPVAVTGTITTSPNVNVHDGAGNTITSTSSALDINLKSASITLPVSGTVTALQGTSPWVVSGTVAATQSGTWNVTINTPLPAGTNVIGHVIADSGSTTVVTGNVTVVQPTGTNLHTVVDSGTITLSGTSPVSGTVTANQGTPAVPANKWPIEIVDSAGVNIATVSAAGAVKVDGSAVTQPVSGTVTANAGTGNFTVVQPTGTNLHVVNDASSAVIGHVITDTGSTTVVTGNVTVVQPTGTNLHTVVDSGTITLSGTSPVSGTVTANQGTANTPANKWPIEIVDSAGVNIATVSAAGAVKVDGSAVTQPVSGTVTANIGTTNGLALDASVVALQVAQASTTSGQKGTLVQGAVTTAAPSYTTGQTDPLSLTTTGALRVDNSANTQPVSGTITANQGTSPWVVQQSATLPVTIQTVGITASSSGDNTIIAAVSAKKIYVFAWNISFSGTVNAKFTDGAGGTLLSGLYYGIVNAGGGNSVSPPNYLWLGSTNTALILNLSGATAVGGSVSYFVI